MTRIIEVTILYRSDKEIKTTINGETRKFASVTADKIELQGQVFPLHFYHNFFFRPSGKFSFSFIFFFSRMTELQYGIDRSPVWYRLLSQMCCTKTYSSKEDNCFLFLIIRLQLYGRAPVGYLNVLYKDGQQSITGNLIVESLLVMPLVSGYADMLKTFKYL